MKRRQATLEFNDRDAVAQIRILAQSITAANLESFKVRIETLAGALIDRIDGAALFERDVVERQRESNGDIISA